jgi:SecY
MSSAPRPISFFERAAVTVAATGLFAGMNRIPLAGIDDVALRHAHLHFSPATLGVVPFVLASGLVVAVALVVPRLRSALDASSGVTGLARASGVLAVVIAVVQAWDFVIALDAAGFLDRRDWEAVAVPALTMVGGTCISVAAAHWVSRRGLVNGFVLYWLLAMTFGSVRGNPAIYVVRAAFEPGNQNLGPSILVVLAATFVAVQRGQDTPPGPQPAASAYRDAPHVVPSLRIPIPASSVLPFVVASTIVPTANSLPHRDAAWVTQLQDDLTFFSVYGFVVVALTVLFAKVLHRPGEIADLLARLGATTRETARAQAAATLRRAWPATFAYMFVLLAAAAGARELTRAGLSTALVALLAATLFDLVTSVRVFADGSDLAPIGDVHAAGAVSALRAALAAEGIETKATGFATLSVLQAFAPYAPVQLLAHPRDAERAVALLGRWRSGEAMSER